MAAGRKKLDDAPNNITTEQAWLALNPPFAKRQDMLAKVSGKTLTAAFMQIVTPNRSPSQRES